MTANAVDVKPSVAQQLLAAADRGEMSKNLAQQAAWELADGLEAIRAMAHQFCESRTTATSNCAVCGLGQKHPLHAAYGQFPALFSPRPESAYEARMGELIGQGVSDVAASGCSPHGPRDAGHG